jgi:hypothetical protein
MRKDKKDAKNRQTINKTEETAKSRQDKSRKETIKTKKKVTINHINLPNSSLIFIP